MAQIKFFQTDEKDQTAFSQDEFHMEIDLEKLDPKTKKLIIHSMTNDVLIYTVSDGNKKELMVFIHGKKEDNV